MSGKKNKYKKGKDLKSSNKSYPISVAHGRIFSRLKDTVVGGIDALWIAKAKLLERRLCEWNPCGAEWALSDGGSNGGCP